MMITDACICPRPRGDSSVRRMALEAHELGFDSLVAIDAPTCEYAGVSVMSGVLVRGAFAQEILPRVKRCKGTDTVVIVEAGDSGFNRAVLAMRGVHVLCGVHLTDRYGFDHVAAKIAADSGIAIDISLAPIIHERGATRQRALDRYLDIVMLQRRFEFPLVLSTHARSVLEMRSVREISALASLVGLDVGDVKQALGNAGRLCSPEPAVQVIQ
ncbi:MAG: ribonuclease P [Methanoregula sp.]|nr:ribonuclease P [Methanoregula sp.]